MVVLKSKLSLLGAFFALSSIVASADLVKDDILEPQEVLTLAPGHLLPENATEQCPGHGSDIYNGGEEPELINTNPLAFANLIKRAGCTFYRSGEARTCVTADNICCPDPNNAQDGWCCAGTAGCGPGTGTLGKCTTRISWTTLYTTLTSSSSSYSTVTTTAVGSTYVTTLVSTSVVVVTQNDVDTLTDWRTVTITAAAAKARRTEIPTAVLSPESVAVPAYTSSVPLETSASKVEHIELRADVTPAPRVVQIRGQLFKRQVRTDISTTTSTRTTYIGSTIYTTTTVFITSTSTAYSTFLTTRTTARNARTTVTSTLTLTMRPGQTVPINPISPQQTDPLPAGGGTNNNGGGGGGGGGGLSKGAQVGIGVGTGAGSLIICIILGFFFWRRRKSKKQEANEMITAAVAAQAATHSNDHKQPGYGVAPVAPVGSPGPNQMNQQYYDPRYSHPGQYGTPSPAPQYGYPPQPGSGYEMSATPAPMPVYPVQNSPPPQQQLTPQQGYNYPKPPSPSVSPGVPGSPTSSTGYQYQNQGGIAPAEMAQPYHNAPSEIYTPPTQHVQPQSGYPQPGYPSQPVYQPQPQQPR